MTRKKADAFRLAAYDYLAVHVVVTSELAARGESTKLTPTEKSMVDMMTEICAERGMDLERTKPHLLEVVDEIVKARCATLFPVYDERDVMGDETVFPAMQADGVAA